MTRRVYNGGQTTMLSPSPRSSTAAALGVANPGPGHQQRAKETIHSGHFMVSDFEAEAQDDEDEVAIPVPESDAAEVVLQVPHENSSILAGSCGPNEVSPAASSITVDELPKNSQHEGYGMSLSLTPYLTLTLGEVPVYTRERKNSQPSLAIDQSLTKLFQCMSLAYRQKLTSPKWNPFKGLRLSWKDKIRLNNVIWRCWHLQFVRRQNTQICQFASPLDVDQHNKPEAVVLEGKYWKRRLATVTAEYKKWRIFFKNKLMGRSGSKDTDLGTSHELEALDWFGPRSNGSYSNSSFPVEDDFYMDFSDTLFSSLTSNQPFPFPNPREIARGVSLADFIQPGLVQLQPNLDDFMDTFEPLQDLLSVRLPPVEEESSAVEDPSTAFNSNNVVLSLSNAAPGAKDSSNPAVAATALSDNFATSIESYMAVDVPSSDPQGMFFSPDRTASNAVLPSYEPLEPSTQLTLSQLLVQQPPLQQQLHPQSRDIESIPQPVLDSPFRTDLANCGYLSAPPPAPPGTTYVDTRDDELSSRQTAQEIFIMPKTALKTRSRSRSGSAVGTAPCPPPLTNRLHLSSSQPSLTPLPNTLAASKANSAPSTGRGGVRNKTGRSTSSALVATAVANVSSLPVSPRGPGRGVGGGTGGTSHVSSANSLRIPVPNQPIVTMAPTPVAVATRTTPSSQDNALMQLLTSDRTPSTSYLTRTPVSPAAAAPVHPRAVTPSPSSSSPSSTHTPLDTGGLNLLADVGLGPFKLGDETSASSGKNSHNAPSTPTTPTPPLSTTHPKPFRPRGEHERGQYKEHRRVCHINAEQKRRCNIKNGFDTLHSLLPGLGGSGSGSGSSHSPSHSKVSEVSKAALLQRGAEYIRQLKAERLQQTEEMEQLRQCIENLNGAISGCQAQLPATGAPVSRQRSSRIKEMFQEWVRVRTLQNWKFWIFSLLIQPLLDTYVATVSTASLDDLCRTVLQWVDQHCSLVALRPAVLSSLRHLSTSTDILTDPSRLPAQAAQAVCKGEQPSQTLH